MDSVFDDRRYLIPFRAVLLPQIFTDVLVIGEGVAGQRAALAAAEHGDVIIVAKGQLRDSNTYWAQGGIAAVMSESDTFESHVQDTLSAGGQLCEEQVVNAAVKAGPAQIKQLIEWGMPLDKVPGAVNQLALGREGGHSKRRVIHSHGDATGKALGTTLGQQVGSNEQIRLFEQCFVLDLITVDGATPQCIGAVTHHPQYGLQVIWSAATILASGGVGQVYRETTNPTGATGDGLALAYRAGAEMADMAFVQFHPTTLYVAGATRALITEAVRGEGAYLIDQGGHRFMVDHHPMAELAPRDVVSQAIVAQLAESGHTHVYLDCRHLGADNFADRFPGITKLLKDFDIDPSTDPIPVHPSAHYMIGGVRTDMSGRTNVAGLYVCGEASCTGLHGANRLASNSLLEGLVFGAAAGAASRERVEAEILRGPVKIISDIRPSRRSELDLSDVRSSLRSLMWRHVGIEREEQQLSQVVDMFDFWAHYILDKIFDERSGWEVQNMLLAGALITRAARWRQESRGTHYRVDHTQAKAAYHVHDLWQRGHSEPGTEAVGELVVVAENQDSD